MTSENQVKVVFLLKRKPGMTFQEFQRYYETEHVKLIKFLPEVCCYVRRYLKPFDRGPVAGDHLEDSEAYDSISEIWFETKADFESAMKRLAQPEVAQAVAADEERLFDRKSIRVYLVEERYSSLPPQKG
jgi:uncharacterized protein (TIGR02118 family)